MHTIQSITCRRLTLGTWAKLAVISNLVGFVTIGLLAGLASLLGFGHVGMGGQMMSGWMALPVAVIAMALMGLVYAVLATGFGFMGLWLFAQFRDIRLDVIASDPPPQA